MIVFWKRCFGLGMILLCVAGLCYVPSGEMEYLLVLCGIAGLFVLLLDDGFLRDIEVVASVFLCAHWSVLFRLPVYYVQRSWMLYRENAETEQMQISKKSWHGMTDEERVEFIQLVVEQEASRDKNTPCRIVPYNRKYKKDYLWVQIDGENHKIFWNIDSIGYHSLNEILEELIVAIQCYRFYSKLDKQEQQILNSFTEKDADAQLIYWMYLLYENLRFSRNTDSYDIITRQYARTKSTWYCKKQYINLFSLALENK